MGLTSVLAVCQPAVARTLLVGPTRALTVPSAAAAVAADGDTIQIDPGSYTDCAVWRQSHLTIAASGAGVILRERVCQNKGIFVTVGDDITIRGIGFEGARAPAHNGAGIRAEGANLTLVATRFLDNENGILAASNPVSTIRILDSEFRANGVSRGNAPTGSISTRSRCWTSSAPVRRPAHRPPRSNHARCEPC